MNIQKGKDQAPTRPGNLPGERNSATETGINAESAMQSQSEEKLGGIPGSVIPTVEGSEEILLNHMTEDEYYFVEEKEDDLKTIEEDRTGGVENQTETVEEGEDKPGGIENELKTVEEGDEEEKTGGVENQTETEEEEEDKPGENLPYPQ